MGSNILIAFGQSSTIRDWCRRNNHPLTRICYVRDRTSLVGLERGAKTVVNLFHGWKTHPKVDEIMGMIREREYSTVQR